MHAAPARPPACPPVSGRPGARSTHPLAPSLPQGRADDGVAQAAWTGGGWAGVGLDAGGGGVVAGAAFNPRVPVIPSPSIILAPEYCCNRGSRRQAAQSQPGAVRHGLAPPQSAAAASRDSSSKKSTKESSRANTPGVRAPPGGGPGVGVGNDAIAAWLAGRRGASRLVHGQVGVERPADWAPWAAGGRGCGGARCRPRTQCPQRCCPRPACSSHDHVRRQGGQTHPARPGPDW